MAASVDLVLASASPRRADLLRQLGVTFSQQATDIDESGLADESPEEYVSRLAREKAHACAGMLNSDCVPILAADTCVVLDGQILSKPADAMDVLAILARLSGREHRVLTAVCLLHSGQLSECLTQTRVQFRNLQRTQVEAYIASGEPFNKAGAYAIQGLAAAFVDSINGSYSGVVGLPLAQTWQLLQNCGVATALDVVGDE